MPRLLKRLVPLCCSTLLLIGCVVGQKYNFGDVQADFSASGTKRIGVAAQDQRPYVLSGKKGPDVVGLLRGGYGNPFNVTTESGKPFAEDVTNVVSSSLAKRGFSTTPVVVLPDEPSTKVMEKLLTTQGATLVLVTINEWRSDTYVNCGLYYDLNLRVFDKSGQLIAENKVQGSDNLGGSFNTASHTKTVVPANFKKRLEELFNNPAVVKALQD